jgi:hypothetical protein
MRKGAEAPLSQGAFWVRKAAHQSRSQSTTTDTRASLPRGAWTSEGPDVRAQGVARAEGREPRLR